MMQDSTVIDYAGNDVQKGDTVITIQGQTSGTVSGVTEEDDGTGFICVRPVHQAYGKGVWYAADQVFRVSRPGLATKKDEPVKPGGLWTRGTRLAPVDKPAVKSPPKRAGGTGGAGGTGAVKTAKAASPARRAPVRKK